MGIWNELLVAEDATQVARRELMAESIGRQVAQHMPSVAIAIDNSGIARALEGGLGSVGSMINSVSHEVGMLADSVNSGMHEINIGVRELHSGIDALHADFNFMMGDVIWRLQQQNDSLISILKTLQAPVGTEAYEYRSRGEDAYLNGWFEEALADLLKSAELNYQDFAVHRTIGNIYLYHCKPRKLQDARIAYERAAKYAKPRDARQAAEAHLFAAITCIATSDWESGATHCSSALALNPKLAEASYVLAQCKAQLHDEQQVINALEYATNADPRYLVQVSSDCLFDDMRISVNAWRDKRINTSLSQVEAVVNRLEEFISANDILTREELNPANELLNQIKPYQTSNSYPEVQKVLPEFTACASKVIDTLRRMTDNKKKPLPRRIST